MKNGSRIFFVLIIVLALAAGLFACGSVPNDKAVSATLISQKENYRLYRILVGSQAVGVRMSGGFFGLGDGDVCADLYYETKNDEGGAVLNEAALTGVADQIADIAAKVNLSCNTLLDGSDGGAASDVWRYNSAAGGERLEISKQTYDMLNLCKLMYAQTGGMFNPALFRVVDLWGFSARFADGVYASFPQDYDRVYDYENNTYPLPSQSYVKAFADKDFVVFDDETENVDGKYYVTKSDVVAVVDGVGYTRWIDFGGVAKGYVCDEVQKLLADKGISNYYVSVGNSSSVCGKNYQGNAYNVAVVNPFDPTTAACTLSAQNNGVSTGGLYNRNYTVDGKTYAHIIDGRSGEPTSSGVCGVTLVTPDNLSAVADCLTTAICQMTAQQIADFVNGYAKDNGIGVLAFVRTVDGQKQLLTNLDVKLDEYSADIALALQRDGEIYRYDAAATVSASGTATTKIVFVVIVCATFAVLAVVSVVLCVTKRHVRKDVVYKTQPPFKRADIYVYFVLATLVVILFVAFARPVDGKATTVVAVDMDSGKTIFAYDISTARWQVYQNDGIDCQVHTDGKTLTVTVRRADKDGKYNTFQITPTSSGVSVRMIDAECGVRKECVKVFGEITSQGSIVCSPNMLKISVE